MKTFCAALAGLLLCTMDLHAGHRTIIVPSLEITQVNDDNLNFSPTEPLADRVRRVSPSLALGLESKRSSAHVSLGLDSEQYANRPGMNDPRARERAAIGLQFHATPRLALAMDGTYIATNTAADLNTGTALAASRVRGTQSSLAQTAVFRISPKLTARASASAGRTSVANGFAMRSTEQSLGLDRRMSPRGVLTFDLSRADLDFNGGTSQTIHTSVLLVGWVHDLGMHDRLLLRVGPRRTDGAYSADIAASFTHTWRGTAVGLSLTRGQTTVVGYTAPLLTDSVQGNLAFSPLRRISVFTSPAAFRTTRDQLQGTVYRLSAGARYTLSSYLQAQVAYTRDTQIGAIDPLLASSSFSHSVLSFGFVTRRNIQEAGR